MAVKPKPYGLKAVIAAALEERVQPLEQRIAEMEKLLARKTTRKS